MTGVEQEERTPENPSIGRKKSEALGRSSSVYIVSFLAWLQRRVEGGH